MMVNRLEIRGLYGYINKNIDFNKDLTLLVGINGSGKTSILNIINWILRPSIGDLCVTEFKLIRLEFSYRSKRYTIVCKHDKSRFTFDLKTPKEKFNPLVVRIKIQPSSIKNDEVLRANLLQEYSYLTPNAKEKKTYDLLSTIPNPTIIGLDRHLYIENSERIYAEEAVTRKGSKRTIMPVLPQKRVKDILNLEYQKVKNQILKLTSNLKSHLMLSTFEGSLTSESFAQGIRKKLTKEDIEAAETRVNNYFKEFEKESFTSGKKITVRKYFARLKHIAQQYIETPNDETTKLLYGLNANQFTKITRLLREFERFEKESNKALQQVSLFTNTINHFFKDSSKRILFKEDTAEIVFDILDKDQNVITRSKDIKFLSSGEQQILILFTYIAFNSQDGKLFIIDEPELSLHIKWQEDFLDHLEKITPPSTQLILATHSPILAGKKREKALVLLPYN